MGASAFMSVTEVRVVAAIIFVVLVFVIIVRRKRMTLKVGKHTSVDRPDQWPPPPPKKNGDE